MPRLQLDLQDTLELENGYEELTSFERQAKYRKTETQFERLDCISEMYSSEIAETMFRFHHISCLSKIMHFLLGGKASLCFGFLSKQDSDVSMR